ncbi:MAG: hypothetical protein LBM13_04885 [Candidatus Ancillula sp.]|jgi:hypothetical protein|nr:hypothetical protein [Candidatus Ancillula sp.]
MRDPKYADDTSLIRLIINELVKIHEISYDDAIDLFYTSSLSNQIADEKTGLFTYAAGDLARMIKFNKKIEL